MPKKDHYIIIAIDPLNQRIIAEQRMLGCIHRIEQYVGHYKQLVVALDMLLKGMRGSGQPTTIEVGVYPGPGPFSKIRRGILISHWLSRGVSNGIVRLIPLSAFNAPSLLARWSTFKTTTIPMIRYGKKPSIMASKLKN